MPTYDFQSQRLYTNQDLRGGAVFEADKAQSNYLLNVLRLKSQARILLFNGRDGEWSAHVSREGRKSAVLTVGEQTRPQTKPAELQFFFAPLKQARMDYMVQKAVEMGAGAVCPVLTQYTQQRKVNLDKMRSYVIEAAEQCGILSIPQLLEPASLQTVLANLPPDRTLIFCDESRETNDPMSLLSGMTGQKLAVLIGPEGGFSPSERTMLSNHDFVISVPLGPRILRADTAAVAALAVIQATVGDWRDDS